MEHIETPSRRKLFAAALEHLALERAAACVLPVPETDPPLFVAVGPAPAIAKLLSDTSMTGAPRALRTAKEALQFLAANPELSDPHQVAKGALKAVERAERGPRATPSSAVEVEFDESEGGHHD
ncbi:hypothetical protein [Massilia timonae]|uniref:hypothetical protein n=1 Tax=Massilia timonae TaxID=47229 RepID=UPI002357DD9E|nr:hypothetical protein [Massilia timonae]